VTNPGTRSSSARATNVANVLRRLRHPMKPAAAPNANAAATPSAISTPATMT